MQTSEPNSKHRPTSLLLWAAIFVCFLYPLSTGPMFRIFGRRDRAISRLQVIYYPLIAASDHCKPVDAFFTWYVEDIWGWDGGHKPK